MTRILIIEDDRTFTRILRKFLEDQDFLVEVTHSLKQGREAFYSGGYDLLLLDYRLPDGTGMELLQTSAFYTSGIPTIIMTSFHDIRTAVRAIKSGAFEYITKPVNPDELLMVIQQALAKQPGSEPTAMATDWIVGNSAVSRQLQKYIELVSPTDMSVVIEGESGTGKEYVARSIHNLSDRSTGPFVALDCGALSMELAGSELFGHAKGAFTNAISDKKGHFELADKGTLFLDEIGNLSYEIQVKLLRALQEQAIQPLGSSQLIKVNVRIVTATNDDLLEEVKKGHFREDLYHRINEFKIRVPPLRERGEDIVLFSEYFMETSNRELKKAVTGFTPEVKNRFATYDWPGNLRELKNVVKRSVLLTGKGEVALSALPEEMNHALFNPDSTTAKDIDEKAHILDVLEKTKYNKTKAAQILQIDRKTLYNKLAKYNIEP